MGLRSGAEAGWDWMLDRDDDLEDGLEGGLCDPVELDRCLSFEPELESDFDPDLGFGFGLLPDLDLDLDRVVGMLEPMLVS